MPQLEGPTTKNIQLCTGGLWGEKGKKIKSLKKKKIVTVRAGPVAEWLILGADMALLIRPC